MRQRHPVVTRMADARLGSLARRTCEGKTSPPPSASPEDGRRKVTGSAARREEAGRLRVDTTEGVTRCVLINGTAVTRRVKAGTRAFPINPHDAPTQMLLLPSHT